MPNDPRLRAGLRPAARSVALVALLALAGGCDSGTLPPGAQPAPPVPPVSAASAPPSPSRPAEPLTTPSPAEPSAPVTPTPTYPPEIAIASVVNFRDAAGAGAGLPLADGGHMVRGLVFRAAALETLSDADLATLEDLGITDVYDLRTPNVARAHPDPKIGDAINHPINLWATSTSKKTPGSTAEKRLASRVKLSREFVTNAPERERLARMLNSFAKVSGPVIVHCSEGKDRTGFVVAVLQLVAGADQGAIMDEYLLSNQYREKLIDAAVAKAGRGKAEATRMDLTLYPQQLQASLDAIEAYGGIDAFLTKGAGLSSATVDALRAKLTGP